MATKLVIGLTGGIASGKSTVRTMLGEMGAHVLDADALGHEAYLPGTETFRQVAEAFGEGVVAEDGTIDRRALGGIVFGDPQQMKRLTDIVWPAIGRIAQERIAQLPAGVVVMEAAVLLEAGWTDAVDAVWVVAVSVDVARERLMARNGLSREDADARIAAQMSVEERVAQATRVIRNDGDEAALRAAVEEAWGEECAAVAAAASSL